MFLQLALLLLVFLGPGYVLSNMLKSLKPAERLTAALVISSLLFGAVGLSLHLVGVGLGFWTFFTVVLITVVAAAIYRPNFRFDYDRRLVALMVVAIFLRVAVYMVSPYPVVGDSYQHFSVAKSFLTDEWFTSDMIDNYWTPYKDFPLPVSYRPPFQDFLTALAMVVNGVEYSGAASMSLLFGIMLVPVVWALAESFAGEKAAFLAASMAVVNSFLALRSLELEPRVFVIFFTLAMFVFSMKGKKWAAAAAACAGLAYLTHYSSLFFIFATAAYGMFQAGRAIKAKDVAVPAAIFIILISPLLIRNIILFGNPIYTTSRYVPFMTTPEDLLLLQPPTISSYLSRGGGPQAVIKAVGYRAINFITTYVPPPNKALQYGLAWTLSSSIIDLVGPVAFIVAVVYALQKKKKIAASPLFFAIAIPSLLAPLLTGYPKSDGLSIDILSPVTPLIIVLAAAYMSKGGRFLVGVVMVSLILQTAWLSAQRMNASSDDGLTKWVGANTPKDAVLMSVDGLRLNFYTGRKIVIPPNEDWSKILSTAKSYGVGYYVLTPADMRLRNITSQMLERDLSFFEEVGDARIYKVAQ
jgi:hypothetical protein